MFDCFSKVYPKLQIFTNNFREFQTAKTKKSKHLALCFFVISLFFNTYFCSFCSFQNTNVVLSKKEINFVGMIKKLLHAIEQQTGLSMQHNHDFVSLSQLIFERLHESIRVHPTFRVINSV